MLLANLFEKVLISINLKVWKPPFSFNHNSSAQNQSSFNRPTDDEIEKYLEEAVNRYSYNLEQALGLLYFNKHDIKKSLSDMCLFVPCPNEWTSEDKIVFEQAFMFHGKNFNKIKQVVNTILKKIIFKIGSSIP